MHAGVRVRICEFEEVVTIKIGHVLSEPLVLDLIQIAV